MLCSASAFLLLCALYARPSIATSIFPLSILAPKSLLGRKPSAGVLGVLSCLSSSASASSSTTTTTTSNVATDVAMGFLDDSFNIETTTASVASWVIGKGGVIGKLKMVKMQNQSSERECVARDDIAQGELVLGIPRACLITKAKGEMTTIGLLLKERNEVLSNDGAYLVLVLLEERDKFEKGRGSEVYENIFKQLPKVADYTHMPLFWSDEDLAELQGSTLLTYLDTRKRTLEKDFALLSEISPWFADSVSRETFYWLYTAVSSRIFSFQTGLNYDVSLLVPMADMLNDKKKPELDWDWEEGCDMFELRALMPIPANAPLHISYGCVPNYARLFNYGFTLDDDMGNDLSLSAEHSSHQARVPLSLNTIISISADLRGTVANRVPFDLIQGVQQADAVANHPDTVQDEIRRFKKASWQAIPDSRQALSGLISFFLCQISVGSAMAARSALSMIRVSVITEDSSEGLEDFAELMSRVQEIDEAKVRRALEWNARPAPVADEGRRAGAVREATTVGTDDDSEDDKVTEVAEEESEREREGEDDEMSYAADTIARKPISLRNERHALETFKAILREELWGFPTTFEEDKDMLAADAAAREAGTGDRRTLRTNLKNALVVRMGEKMVLQHYSRVMDAALKYITRLETQGNGNLNMEEYAVLLEETLSDRDCVSQ